MKKIRRQVITNKTKFAIPILLLSLVLVFTCCVQDVSAAPGDTMYVNGSSGNDSYDGYSWVTSKLTIKNATGTVNNGGTMNIADGTYSGTGNTNITVDRNMTVQGQSKENTVINGTDTDRIFIIPSGFTVLLQNLTFTNGYGTDDGGAIHSNGNLTVNDCIFTSNYASDNAGGAIYSGGNLTVNNSTFINNAAHSYGGAIAAQGDSTINNCTFIEDQSGYGGGAIFNDNNMVVERSTFINNPGYYYGNIWNLGDMIVNSSTFQDTECWFGAGLCSFSNITVTNSTFTNNTAWAGGGIFIQNTANITSSTFTNNKIVGRGGAVFNNGGTVSIHFCRIIGNDLGEVAGTLTDATLNWWGSNSDPSSLVESGVNVTPWLVLNVTAVPNSIPNGGNSSVTADLQHDSNGIYHNPIDCHVPDGIPITLAVPWGSFTDPLINHSFTGDTLDGAVNTTFYANEGTTPLPPLNPVKVTATADGYTTNDTESAYITVGNATNLNITKTGPITVVAGNEIDYIVTITDNGPDSADGVTLDDVISNIGAFKAGTLQYRFKVNDGSWSTWTSFTNPLHLDLGTVLNGKTAAIEINGTVDPSTPKNTFIINTATADTTTTPGPKVATSTTTVDTQSDLVVDKSGPATVIAGNQLNYAVTVTNNGPSDAQNVVIQDIIPSVLQNVTHDSFNLGTIGAGQTRTVTITGKVLSNTALGTVIENNATVTSDTSGTITPSSTVSTTVNTQSALTVDKTGLSTVTAGETYTGLYTVNVTNNGPSDAQNVTVTDTLPFNVVNGSYNINGGSPVSFTGNSLTVNLGTLTSGTTATIVINGEVTSDTPAGVVSDTANVHTDTGPTYNFASNPFSTTVNTQSVLNVVKESLINQVVAGVNYTDPIYRITVTDNGPSDARDVQVQDNIPDQIVNREYRINTNSWISFTGTLNRVIPYLARGASDVIEIRGSIPSSVPAGSMSNVASASVYGTSFNSNLVNTAIIAIADVDLTKWVNDFRPDVGEVVTFTVKACNHGPSDATNVLIKDEMPSCFEDLEVSVPAGTSYANGMWIIPYLKSGEEAVLTFEGKVTPCMAGKVTTNTATKIHQTEEDPDAIDVASVAIYVPKSDLYIWMNADKNNPQIGEIVNITVKLGNRGPDEAKYVEVTIPLPEGFEFIDTAGDGMWSYNAGTVTWILKSVEVGDPYLYITGRIVSPGDLVFTASLLSETYNANTQGVNPLTIHAQSQPNPSSTVKAANKTEGKTEGKTVGMQNTGAPITGLILAFLAVLGGILTPKKK